MTDDIEQRLRTRLDPLNAVGHGRARSDRDLNPDWPPADTELVLRPAAVLAPIVRRAEGWTLMFTQRAHDLAEHGGQISFPGGRIETGESVLDAALRETEEEIGLARALIEPLGGWEPYETGTGYRMMPVAGLVAPQFMLTLEAREVAETFEVPFAFLMDPANHQRQEGEWRGRRGAYYVMQYENRFIWGATAAIIRALYERLYL